ncbi:GNAT family N-acetyltransferase [Nonomuraea jiangxiensis]|uniref:Acetyltransferase (GNAT) family protein n=1 Tax=Nonomuraea jiangxiensis TaxID=633440 RepID=A0A1G8BEM6_9ACTN|nr:GNAT family N-acetyltransferase [Nonomuraea jiangxiensis]SDH31561.1 Acetyltransferase (GNAT) family protein [Nonomuraea jiangxiensis]
MSFAIRKASPEDAAGIEAVRIATWRVAYRGVMPDPFLDGLEVRPEEFSTGMGRALMAASTEELSSSGHAEVGLWVLADNPRARRFYERFGFTLSGRTKMWPDPPLEELHYRMTLAANT